MKLIILLLQIISLYSLEYTYVPIRESEYLTRSKEYPNFKGIGCATSFQNYSFLFTTNQVEGWGNSKCSTPDRIVEVFKVDVSRRPAKNIVELHSLTDNCSDSVNSTYIINSNLQLCNLKYPNGNSIQNRVRSIRLHGAHTLKLFSSCEGTNLVKTITNLDSDSICIELNEDSTKYQNAAFSHDDWNNIFSSHQNDQVIKQTCNDYGYLYSEHANIYSGCSYYCCMLKYKNIGYIRFMTEPNPMIIDRLLIGDPTVTDNVLQQQYVGSLGSDTIVSCGVDPNKNILYYIGSNALECSSVYNTDASIVRIHLSNFTYWDRTFFKEIAPPLDTSLKSDEYYINPGSSIVDDGKYMYLTFYDINTAIFKINLSNIQMNEYIILTHSNADIDYDFPDNYNLKYYSVSALDNVRRFAYFVSDPITRSGNAFIARLNLTDETSKVQELIGVTGISSIKVDSYTGIIYITVGLSRPTVIYHFDVELNKIEIEDSCGSDQLLFQEERIIRNIEVDSKTGFLYAFSEFQPFVGISRFVSKNLVYNPTYDDFELTVPFAIARQHKFNDEHLLIFTDEIDQANYQNLNNPDSFFYVELVNISVMFAKLDLMLIASTADGPNLPYIFLVSNFGCIPGRGLDADQCVSCIAGKYSSNISYSACDNCLAGRKSSIEGSDECELCELGKYTNITGSTSCTKCSLGKFSDIYGNDMCEDCPAGTYLPVKGSKSSIDCITCQEGQVSGIGAVICVRCKAGEYKGNTNDCFKCPVGKFGSNIGVNNINFCQNCPVGKYLNLSGKSSVNSCINCPLGKYNILYGSKDIVDCYLCDIGLYSNIEGSEKCVLCNDGFISTISRKLCIECEKGKYTQGPNADDHIVCQECPPGKYSETIAANSINLCQNCPRGKYSDEVALNTSKGCIPCNPGTYSSTLGALSIDSCKTCNLGKYNSRFGAQTEADCIPAPSGSFAVIGDNVSQLCPMGKYNSDTGNFECKFCEPGTYSDVYGGIICKSCPDNSEQSRDKATWVCSRNSYELTNGTDRECLKCPQNTICPKGTKLSTINIAPGYWRKNKNSLNIVPCKFKEFCLGGIFQNTTCKKGHTGPLCNVCSKGYAKNGDFCVICGDDDKGLQIFLSILFGLIVVVVLFFLIKTANDIGETKDEFSGVIKILTNYLQVFSLAKNFDVKWPSIFYSMFSVAQSASGPSLQFYSAQCTFGWTYYDRLIVYFVMPIGYILAVIIAVSLTGYFIARKNNNQINFKFMSRWIKTALVVGLFLIYPSVIKSLLQALNCVNIDDTLYLQEDYSIECFIGTHADYVFATYFFLALYGLGIPLGSFYLIYQYRNRLYSQNIANSLKFLYIEYKPNRYYWELVIVFRKVAIICMSVFLFSEKTVRYQMIAASWVLQICLFLHTVYQPFDTMTSFGSICNKLEMLSLGSLVVTLNSGIVFGTTDNDYELGIFESILSICVVIINIVLCVVFFYYIILTGSDKSKKNIKDILKKLFEKNKLKCFQKCCKKSYDNVRRWSMIELTDVSNVESKTSATVILDNYLENLDNKSVKEEVLKLHTDIEIYQKQQLDSIKKYNKKIDKIKEILKDNDDVLLQLFIDDIVEHKNSVEELFNEDKKEIVI